MPTQIVERTKFQINSSNQGIKPGVAGRAYMTGTTQKAVLQKGEIDNRIKWESNHSDYVPFISDNNIPREYLSLLAVPLISPSGKTIGVLCIDCMSPTQWNSEFWTEVAHSAADKILRALIIAQKIYNISSRAD